MKIYNNRNDQPHTYSYTDNKMVYTDPMVAYRLDIVTKVKASDYNSLDHFGYFNSTFMLKINYVFN